MTSAEYKQEDMEGVSVDLPLAMTALILSVASNGFATAAIAYKAWKVLCFGV
jgi:hypothetical protein